MAVKKKRQPRLSEAEKIVTECLQYKACYDSMLKFAKAHPNAPRAKEFMQFVKKMERQAKTLSKQLH